MRIMIHITVVPDDESENWKETAKSFTRTVVISKRLFQNIHPQLKAKWLAKEVGEPINDVVVATKDFILEVLE